MDEPKYINFSLTFILIVAFKISAIGQRIIIDTTLAFSYNCYNEQMILTKTLVPDSTYKRLNGRSPKEEEERRYSSFSFTAAYQGDQIHTFEDFKICFNDECYQFNYPGYRYFLNKNLLLESLESIHLKSVKNNTIHKPTEILFKFNDGSKIILNQTTFESDSLMNELKQKLSETRILSVLIPPITYPYGTQKEDCGQNLITFREQEFQLFGR